MTFASALGRIGELESTLRQFVPTAPPVTETDRAAPVRETPSMVPDAGRSITDPAALNSSFDALMRVLTFANGGAVPGSAGPGFAAPGSTPGINGSPATSGGTAAPSSSVSVSAPSSATGAGHDVVSAARKYLGVPYLWGGNDPARGLDCSGFTKLVFQEMGVTLPRVAIDQARAGREIPSLDQAKPGDLIVSHAGGHIGIYVGEGKMIHSPRPGRSVAIDQVNHVLDSRGVMTIRRVIEPSNQMSTAGAADGTQQVSEQVASAQRQDFETRAGARS